MGMYIHPVDKVMYALSSYMQQGVMGNQSIRISGLMLLHCLGRVIRFLKINSINFSGFIKSKYIYGKQVPIPVPAMLS